MTIDTQKLAESIERVRRLDRVRRNANPTDFESEAPLMADIIRKLINIIQVHHEALETARKRIDYLGYCTGTETHISSNESAFLPRLDKALSISAPLVKEE